MDSIAPKGQTVGDAYLSLLADRGVDYLFANSGTDFAPLIEGFVKASSEGRIFLPSLMRSGLLPAPRWAPAPR